MLTPDHRGGWVLRWPSTCCSWRSSAYILIGLRLEEKDLVATLGKQYEGYRRRVPMLLPIPKRSDPS